MKYLIALIIMVSIGIWLNIPLERIEVVNPVPAPTPTIPTLPPPIGLREVSSYTIGNPLETDDTPCIGAYGQDLCAMARDGIRTCASNEFPQGTQLIVGDGLDCMVMDRMNKRYKNRVDIAELDYEASSRFGVQKLQVIVLK